MRHLVAGVGALVLALTAPAVAGAAWQATGTDAADPGLAAGRDIVGVNASYDDARGELRATVTLRGAPTAADAGVVGVLLGTAPQGTLCSAPYAVLIGSADPAQPIAAAQLSSGESGPATKTVSGRKVTLALTDASLAGLGLRCAQVEVVDPGDTERTLDTLNAPLRLAQRAPTPKRRTAAKTKSKRRTSGRPKPRPASGSLAGRYFTRPSTDPISGTTWHGYAFVDERWVYRGIPHGGFPACTQKTAGVDADGDPTDGCLPYSYDAKRRVVTIDGRRGTVTPNGQRLKVGDEEEMLDSPVPAAGARYDVTLESLSGSGFGENVTVTSGDLRLTRDGRFSLATSTGGTVGSGGEVTGGFGSDRDAQGRYEVLSGARLRLTFDSGKVEVRTIAQQRDWTTGRADPAVDGFLIDDEWFYSDDD